MQTLKGKKLLILAGAAVHCKVVAAAKELGVYTIVTDYLENSPAKLMADESWMLNITDIDGIVNKCKEEQVDGVLNFCIDPCQRPYQLICEKLGLPCYGTAEQFHIMTDKPAFKQFCIKNGLDVIPSYTVQDIENDNCEYPIFIKPTDSRGSRGQAVCYTKSEALEGIRLAEKESSNGGVVIEKFMLGKQDFAMTYFVCDGKAYLTRTCDRYLGRIEDGLNKQCIGCINPSKHLDFYIEKVHQNAVNFIQKLGIKNGPVFMQGFVDENTVRFYDPGLRFPGGEYEKMLKEITGVDLMSALVEFALTGSMTKPKGIDEDPVKLANHYAIQLPITCKPGKIQKIVGIKEISNDERVASAFRRYEDGETVPQTGDVRQRACEVALIIDGNESVKENILWVQSKIKILDENSEDMTTSLLDAAKLDY